MENDTSKSSLLWKWIIADPLQATRSAARKAYQMSDDRRLWLAPLGVGIALLVLSAVGYVADPEQFFFSYHTAWLFCLTIALGGLFFIFFQHLTKAEWSVVVRRISESLVWAFPLLAVLGLPQVFGMEVLFEWTIEAKHDPASPEFDETIAGKSPYLNEPFFFARVALYFGVWTYLSWRLYTYSIEQDLNPKPDTPYNQRFTSAWGLLVTGITVTFASFDLVMSMEPHWYSTIFGVYIFSGAFLTALCVITVVAASLQRGGMLKDVITVEHYHDLGKYTFGMVVFWAYIAFSQYMLIWYGDIPKETFFYRMRLEEGWQYHSAALLFGHFIIPFILLLPRFAKRSVSFLAIVSVALIGMHWVEMHWFTMPNLNEQGGFHWLDFTTWFGLAGIYAGIFMYRLQRHSLVPQKDPRLGKSLRFENV